MSSLAFFFKSVENRKRYHSLEEKVIIMRHRCEIENVGVLC